MNDRRHLRPLAELDDYELKNEDQDIRGKTVLGPSGQSVGSVQELLVDREHDRVAAVRLNDGAVIPVGNLERRGDAVLLCADGAAGASRQDGGEEQRIPLVQEEMLIGKRQVERGGVRVHSRIVEEPVREDVTLREEQVSVARRPVEGGRDLGAAPFEERTIAMTQRAEEAVVSKDARVVEEVIVRKDVNERVERVEDSVRHTEVDVQDHRTGRAGTDR